MEFFGALALGTIGFVVAFAYINMRQTQQQLEETRKRREQAPAKAVLAAE